MTKLLDQAIAKARALSEPEQDAAAEALFAFLASDDAKGFPLDRQARRAIDEALGQVERGEFVPDNEIEALWRRHGI